MSMYLKQIEQLVALQHIDSEILELMSELEAAPKEVEGLQAMFDEKEGQRAGAQEKIDHLKQQEKRLLDEIEEDTLKIKKAKNKLMMVSNTKEYHAMMREMDNMEKLNRMREEERVALSEELERQTSGLEDISSELENLRSVLDAKKENLETRVNKAKSRLTGLDKQRKNSGSSVPPPVLSRYEFIRSRLDSPVIVPVEQGVCSGCHIAIPPQSFIELQKGQQILSCPNCQRLIYWCEHFTPEDEQTKVKDKVKKSKAAHDAKKAAAAEETAAAATE